MTACRCVGMESGGYTWLFCVSGCVGVGMCVCGGDVRGCNTVLLIKTYSLYR